MSECEHLWHVSYGDWLWLLGILLVVGGISFWLGLRKNGSGASGNSHSKQEKIDLGYHKFLDAKNMQEARVKVEKALTTEGFGILTEIDVRAILKQKMDVDFRPYIILGACNPKLAHQALQIEPNAGMLIPCNVVLDEVGPGKIKLSIIRPQTMFDVLDNVSLQPIIDEAEARIERVLVML